MQYNVKSVLNCLQVKDAPRRSESQLGFSFLRLVTTTKRSPPHTYTVYSKGIHKNSLKHGFYREKKV